MMLARNVQLIIYFGIANCLRLFLLRLEQSIIEVTLFVKFNY